MLLIRNGRVIDPANSIDAIMDVAVEGDKITAVAPHIKPKSEKDNVIDAEGCFVLPGLIDHHAHFKPFAKIGLPSEAVCFSSGVTTAVDAGSTGCDNFASRLETAKQLRLTLKAYLNVCSIGLDSLPDPLEDVNPDHWNRGKIAECFEKYGDSLIGLKLRTSAPIVKELGWKPLKAMLELAGELGVSVMVHCTNPPGYLGDLLDMLRPGDVITHMYMNQGPCLIENGHVIPEAISARERGVLFETADARLHFGLPVAQAAIGQDFLPDIIATDITKLSMYLRPTAFSLAMQMAKYTHLGIPFYEVVRRCTINPARQMGIADCAGSLTVGHPADVAVFKPLEKENFFADRPFGNPDQKSTIGHTIYRPMLTLKSGEMVYRDIAF